MSDRARTALVTGSSGVVGRALCSALAQSGANVVRWDRERYPPNEPEAIDALLDEVRPAALYHLATAAAPVGIEDEYAVVGERWPEHLARRSAADGFPIVFTSTVMVYTDDLPGPYTPETVPDARDGYAKGKLVTESILREGAPETARVVRIGWQIASAPTGNHMVAHLERTNTEQGAIEASTRWLPATSLVDDTALALLRAAGAPAGTYLAQSNDAMSFFDIVRALNVRHAGRWDVRATDDFVHDQRMLDDRLGMPALSERLRLTLDG